MESPSTDQCGIQSATQVAVQVTDRKTVTEAIFILAKVARIYVLNAELIDEVRVVRVRIRELYPISRCAIDNSTRQRPVWLLFGYFSNKKTNKSRIK